MFLEKISLKQINIFIFILLLIGFVSIIFLFKDGNECLSNPLVYGAKKITTEDSNLFCSCTLMDGIYPTNFFFDQNNLTLRPS